jgi:hypothetical protein
VTSTDLVRPSSSMLWELRGCWATGRRVALSLDADVRRAEGHVTAVAATDAYVKVGDLMVPTDRILAVHLPSRLGDSTARGGDFHGPGLAPVQIAGQRSLENWE